MLTRYDYIVLAFYFLFILSLGYVFRHLAKGSKDYFAGGQRMCWWMLGGSLFISNFSCWTFTGASGVAQKYGVLIFYVYLMDVLGYIIAYLFFCTRLRRMRLITAVDGIRRRFGPFNEQFFNWYGIISAPLTGAVWLVGLSVILATVFDMDKVPVIVGTGTVVLIMAMSGGNWAVVASDFIQLLLLMTVSVATAVLTVIKIGGVGALMHQIPAEHWQIFFPLGSIKYDWLFLAATVIGGVLLRNNMMTASKYIAAKDDGHARKAALIPLIGYLVMPIFWFIPPMASHTLVPDLLEKYQSFSHPEEAAYIATAIEVLPRGLLGLLVVGLFAATMSSLDTAYNKNAGFIVCNFYRDVLRPDATDKQLAWAGKIATVICGIAVIASALLIVRFESISIFDWYLYFAAFFGTGASIAFLLGMFVRNTPPWAAWSTSLLCMVLSVLLFGVLRHEAVIAQLMPMCGDGLLRDVYAYIIKSPFFMTYLVVCPVGMGFFMWTRRFYNPAKYPAYVQHVDHLFDDMQKPVNFEAEVGDDNSAQQAKLLGWMAMSYGIFLALMMLIPNPMSGRLAIGGCGACMMLIGGGLLLYSRIINARK